MAETIKGEDYQVDWLGEEVLIILEDMTAEALEACAFDIEGLAKQRIIANDQVDTGFMVNSVYAKGAGKSSHNAAIAAMSFNPDAEAFPEANLSGDQAEALVAVAAEYGLWQELLIPYLYPALEAGAIRAGGIIETVAKGKGL